MKKRQFLAPLAFSLAALLNTASADAGLPANTPGPNSQAWASAAPNQDAAFVLTRSQQHVTPDSAASHTSHASHASHHSHRSHYSGAY